MLRGKLLELLEVKPPKYITRKFMGESLYSDLLIRTDYLPEDSKISERLYHVIHEIRGMVECLTCGEDIYGLRTFNLPVDEYLNRFCSRSCTASYEYDMTSEYKVVQDISDDILIDIIKKGNLNLLRRDAKLMDSVKYYLFRLIGDDYKRMTSSQALYFIRDDLSELPRCPITKDYLEYLDAGRYRKHSSQKASANNKETIKKRIETVRQKYGVDNVSQSDEIKERILQTNQEKYGVDNYTQTEEYKRRVKSGEINSSISEEGKERARVANYKRSWERILSFSDKVKPLFPFEDYRGCGFDKIYKWLCVETNKPFYGWYHQALVPKSPYIYDGSNIEVFIKDYLIKNDILFHQNTRSLINPYELDFYLPDHKIAIECNGLYWHSETSGKGDDYHLTKTNLCKERGIRLLQIFSDEISIKPSIVISKLNSILSINKRKLYARKCKVKEIDSKLKSKFLSKYHLQGNDRSLINLGLFYKGKLVSVMTFCKKRIALGHTHVENEYELSRFCNNYTFYIVGGASKLLKYFERKYKPKKIITYADKRWSEGGVYFKLGFTHTHDSKPSYWYTKNCLERVHRFNFRKSELSKKLESFNHNLTEWENMNLNGWHRVWDCGNMVFIKIY